MSMGQYMGGLMVFTEIAGLVPWRRGVHGFLRFVGIQVTFDSVLVVHLTTTVVCWLMNLIPPMILVTKQTG